MVDFEKLCEERNLQNGFMNQIGFVTTEVKELYAKGEILLTSMHGNPIGSVHGGVLFAMADTVGGIAATSIGSYCTTVSGSINYLNPAINCEKLIGEATPIKVGHNLAVIQVMIRDEKGTDIACAMMTYHYFWDKMPFTHVIREEE